MPTKRIMKSFFNWFNWRFKKWHEPNDMTVTERHEISCDEVFAVLDEFAEAVHRGENVLLLMPLVRQHLDMCPGCQAEYETLLRMLQPDAG